MGIYAELFAPFYLYVPICYTDTFCMPFIAFTFYLIIKWVSADSKKDRIATKKLIRYVIVGSILFVGFKLKGSLIILLIAFSIYMFFRFKITEAIKTIVSMLAGFILLSLLCSMLLNASNIISAFKYKTTQAYYRSGNTCGNNEFCSCYLGFRNLFAGSYCGWLDKHDVYNLFY